eukprot:3941974-Rhodomonas_salina.7
MVLRNRYGLSGTDAAYGATRGAGSESFIAGETVLFLVLARDRFSNTLSSGGSAILSYARPMQCPVLRYAMLLPGAEVTAQIVRQVDANVSTARDRNESEPAHVISVEDNGDGSYLAAYRLTVAGSYHIMVQMNRELGLGGPIQVEGYSASTASEATSGLPMEYIGGIPYPVGPQTVVRALLSDTQPRYCAVLMITCGQASQGTAGVTGSFVFWARDMFSNRLSTGGAQFDLQMTGTQPPLLASIGLRGSSTDRACAPRP